MFYNRTTHSFANSISNFGATYTDAGLGTAVTANASANVKGATTQLQTGIAQQGSILTIAAVGGNASATVRRYFVDIMVDYAAGVGGAGSSWSVLVPNLAFNSPAFAAGASQQKYFFPLYIPVGAALGARCQCSAGGAAVRIVVLWWGTPHAYELVKAGSKITAVGADTATTSGVAVTPGTNAKGSYSAALGTVPDKSFWHQLGVLSSDTTMTANAYLFDLATGASQQYMVLQDQLYCVVAAAEQAGMLALGGSMPLHEVSAGESLYARAAAAGGAPDTTMSVVAYAVSN